MQEGALTEQATDLFPRLSKFKEFYLVGGTALALQIGHRVSVDFDLFSFNELPRNILQQVKQIFPASSITVTYRSPEQLNLLVDEVQVTFLHYPYPVLDPFISYQNVPLISIREIASMKALAIGKRLAYKDYIDWYFMLKEKHVTLQDVISLSEKKFGADFNDRLFLGQLVTFEEVPTQEIRFLRDPVERKGMEQFLKKTVQGFKLT